ncbi:ABC transporter substrate-binding protein [Flagellimonas meridianipacifica]|uniref:Thiamine pyrimidine synthase n=1 Tax=Flagellimonas meridianipacifica TaxID=1080225 RepID=A0A2T0MG84_9FLAO|nr:ABC transporter substrate-binding protein [Allomuricauda pacifica]PRX56582.1 ABC-type nitrate/sulfonate/bicarbonate transport system substrate-binding protein [Allomuricauda pacifica]
MKTLKLALDWTPNTNHIGFFVSKELGYYKEEGLQVELLNAEDDNYTVTPAKKVELGKADMALCPFESIISYRTKRQAFDAIGIATIFQEDLSAIVVLEDSSIERPSDLDGKTYASYKARYEDEIVRQMIINDGGKGEMDLVYPDKLGIWETLLSKKYDSTWIFMNWEGVQAHNQGVRLRAFRMSDYGIPYGYSPVLMVSKSKVDNSTEAYSSFLKATKKGFMYAKENPEQAANILRPFVSETDSDIDLVKSQKESLVAYGDTNEWGKMEKNRVNEFLQWLKETNLETSSLVYEDLVYQGLDY